MLMREVMQKDSRKQLWNADIVAIRQKNSGNLKSVSPAHKPVADISVSNTQKARATNLLKVTNVTKATNVAKVAQPIGEIVKPQPSTKMNSLARPQASTKLISQEKPQSAITKPLEIKPNNQAELTDDSMLEDVSKSMYKPSYYKHAQKMAMTEHIAEFRKRSLWCMLALFIGGVIGYKYQEQIIVWLVKPLGQQLFYTSPTGGFDFLIKICLFFGFILAVPVIIYNFFKFISPAIPAHISYSFVKIIIISIISALVGVAFAYFVSLPAALHFLSNFSNQQVTSLISAQEYFNFVMLYMAGFALLFQMPLVFSFINKVKPLKPARLLKQQRVVILVSFIIAAVLTPTPDPINQTLMAAPIIALYQTSIGVVWRENKRKSSKKQAVSQLSFT